MGIAHVNNNGFWVEKIEFPFRSRSANLALSSLISTFLGVDIFPAKIREKEFMRCITKGLTQQNRNNEMFAWNKLDDPRNKWTTRIVWSKMRVHLGVFVHTNGLLPIAVEKWGKIGASGNKENVFFANEFVETEHCINPIWNGVKLLSIVIRMSHISSDKNLCKSWKNTKNSSTSHQASVPHPHMNVCVDNSQHNASRTVLIQRINASTHE